MSFLGRSMPPGSHLQCATLPADGEEGEQREDAAWGLRGSPARGEPRNWPRS